MLSLYAGLHAQWVSSTGTLGSWIECLAVSDTNLFVGSENGVFLSTNSGASWTAVTSGLPAYFNGQVIAVNGTSIFLVVGVPNDSVPGLFRSTNNGTSWTKLDFRYTNSITSFAFIGTNIFAGSWNGGIFLSTDNGASWTTHNSGFPKDTNGHVQLANVLVANGTNLFAGTGDHQDGGVFLSTDNGMSWAATGLTNSNVNNLAVVPDGTGGTNIVATTWRWADLGRDGHVFLSTDYGTSWAVIDSGLPNTWVMSLAAVSNGSGGTNLFVGTGGEGVFLSTDNGKHWKSAGLSRTFVSAVAVSSNGAGVTKLFAGNLGGWSTPGSSGNVFLTTDNGINWTTTILNTSIQALALTPNETGSANLFAVASSVFLSSTNNGAIWTATGLPMANFTALAVSSTSRGTGGIDIFAGAGWDGVYLSTDKGTSWSAALDSGLTDTYVNFLAVIPNEVGDTMLFAGTNGSGGFFSTNRGTSWIAVPGFPNSTVTAFVITGSNQFIGTKGSGVFLLTDNDSSWSAINAGLTNLTVNALVAYDTNLFAGTNGGGVFLSTNNGSRWTAVNNGLMDKYVLALAVSGTSLFAGTYGGGVFLSTNNGTSWTAVSTGLINTIINAFVVSGKELFTGTASGIWRRPLSEMVAGVQENFAQIPNQVVLSQNYPNPFNSSTNISFTLPSKTVVTLKVFDILGREITTILSEELSAGTYSRQWNANGMTSGVYFCRLQGGSFMEIKKSVLLR
jgi:hypothetical protein